MRIIAGAFRGRPLASVGKGDPGAHLRPTSDRVRESLFSMLTHRVDFDGLRILDLFAGTGALGLEALSRGAEHCTFVDSGRVAQRLIRDNIKRLDVADQTQLIASDTKHLPPADAPSDVVFLDPPYGKSLGEAALASATRAGWVAPDALIVWEENSPQSAPGFATLTHKRYGDTHVTLLEPAT